jgi:hypothetical protein
VTSQRRIENISDAAAPVSFDQFRAFQRVLQRVDDLDVAVRTFVSARGEVSPRDFVRVANAVAGVKLEEAVVGLL